MSFTERPHDRPMVHLQVLVPEHDSTPVFACWVSGDKWYMHGDTRTKDVKKATCPACVGYAAATLPRGEEAP